MAYVNLRLQKHRDALRMVVGLRPVQIWGPATRRPDFAEACQCQLVAQLDAMGVGVQ